MAKRTACVGVSSLSVVIRNASSGGTLLSQHRIHTHTLSRNTEGKERAVWVPRMGASSRSHYSQVAGEKGREDVTG